MKIKCAAILYNGVIYEGQSHCEIGLKMVREKICTPPYPHGEAQGFVSDDGKFFNRYQSLRIAIHAGQVPHELIKKEYLYSEDLRGIKRS